MRHALTGVATVRRERVHTFQQLRTDIHKLHLVPQVTLTELPDARDKAVLLSCAAGHPTVDFIKMKIKIWVFFA